jgi:hypothetical protein
MLWWVWTVMRSLSVGSRSLYSQYDLSTMQSKQYFMYSAGIPKNQLKIGKLPIPMTKPTQLPNTPSILSSYPKGYLPQGRRKSKTRHNLPHRYQIPRSNNKRTSNTSTVYQDNTPVCVEEKKKGKETRACTSSIFSLTPRSTRSATEPLNPHRGPGHNICNVSNCRGVL